MSLYMYIYIWILTLSRGKKKKRREKKVSHYSVFTSAARLSFFAPQIQPKVRYIYITIRDSNSVMRFSFETLNKDPFCLFSLSLGRSNKTTLLRHAQSLFLSTIFLCRERERERGACDDVESAWERRRSVVDGRYYVWKRERSSSVSFDSIELFI